MTSSFEHLTPPSALPPAATAERSSIRLTFEVGRSILRIAIAGTLDRTNAAKFEHAVAAGTGRRRIIVDCSELTFIDASGARAIISVDRNRNVEIDALTGFPLRILRSVRWPEDEPIVAGSLGRHRRGDPSAAPALGPAPSGRGAP